MQGDREDRIRIRQQAERQEKHAAAQQEADELTRLPASTPPDSSAEQTLANTKLHAHCA